MADSETSSNRSLHPLDIMPGWAWAVAFAVLVGTASLMGLAALDIMRNSCTTTHALCAKTAQ